MKMSFEEFERQLAYGLSTYVPGGYLQMDEMNPIRLKARYHIGASLFIDIFYAIRTQKISFAVVQERERLFGIDNLGGWHCHPLGKPEDHKPIDEPSIEEIVSRCAIAIEAFRETG